VLQLYSFAAPLRCLILGNYRNGRAIRSLLYDYQVLFLDFFAAAHLLNTSPSSQPS
jgi:hypothetical protein